MGVHPVYSDEWGAQLEADFDDYMERLYESVDADPSDDPADEVLDVTGNYFCGCSTCERRATWTWLMVRIMEAQRDGVITLEDDDGDDGADGPPRLELVHD
jgi:hypothetical protein